jgi:G3E family GTPase
VRVTSTRRPVTVVTGFLGTGKTTLLGKILSDPSMANTAVLVNEFGEVGLDHHLLRRVDERTVLLGSGCVCCTTREDLVGALLELLDLDQRGEIPRLDRVVVETTGLADPAPILQLPRQTRKIWRCSKRNFSKNSCR